MALVHGTNSGFLTTAPTTNPLESSASLSDPGFVAQADTTPATTITVIEMGVWIETCTQDVVGELGIYTNDPGLGTYGGPADKVGSVGIVQTGTTSEVWVKDDTMSIVLNASTKYWLAFFVNEIAGGCSTNLKTSGGEGQAQSVLVSATELPATLDVAATNGTRQYAIYAKYVEGGGGGSIVPILNSYRMRRN